MATNKARIKQLEQRRKARLTANPETLLILRRVDYRAGIDPAKKESADAIPVRWVTLQDN